MIEVNNSNWNTTIVDFYSYNDNNNNRTRNQSKQQFLSVDLELD